MRILHPLAILRKRNKHTQADMARITGLTFDLLGRIERGQQIPDYHYSKMIGEKYGVEWYVIMESCVEYKDQVDKFNNSWVKISEPSTYSSVCINQKCETGCAN